MRLMTGNVYFTVDELDGFHPFPPSRSKEQTSLLFTHSCVGYVAEGGTCDKMTGVIFYPFAAKRPAKRMAPVLLSVIR